MSKHLIYGRVLKKRSIKCEGSSHKPGWKYSNATRKVSNFERKAAINGKSAWKYGGNLSKYEWYG